MKLNVALGVLLIALTPLAVFCQTADADTKTAIEKMQAEIDTLKSQIADPEGAIQVNIADTAKLKKITVSGYAQLRLSWDQAATNTAAAGDQRFALSQRRVRLKVAGRPTDTTNVVFQFDMGDKGFTTKDAYIEYFPTGDATTGITTQIGQFAVPFGYQNAASSSSMDTPERAQIVRDLFPDEYDRGIRVLSKSAGMIRWDIAMMTGAGQNNTDSTQNKDFVARLRMKPTQSFDCAVSGYKGGKQFLGSGTFTGSRENYGFDFQYYLENMSIKGEMISGDKITIGAPGKTQRDTGYYLTTTYNVTPKNAAVCMYDFQRIAGDAAGSKKAVTLGVNHYLDSNSKLRFFYIWKAEQKANTKNNSALIEMLSTF